MGSQEGAEKKQEALPRSRLLALGGEGNSELFGGLSPRGPSLWLRASHVRSVKCLLG